jgi:CheY-like chemotaxis protein
MISGQDLTAGTVLQGSYDYRLVADGFEATAAIRERERVSGRHVPIVAMTAHALKGDEDRCLDSGMDTYISKPIRRAQLYEMIERMLESRDGEKDGSAVNAAGERPTLT